MSERRPKLPLAEMVEMYQKLMPVVLADRGRVPADAIEAGRQGISGLAVLMMTVGEPERTRQTFREAAAMFTGLADLMESRH